jgi:hypothetical protein
LQVEHKAEASAHAALQEERHQLLAKVAALERQAATESSSRKSQIDSSHVRLAQLHADAEANLGVGGLALFGVAKTFR